MRLCYCCLILLLALPLCAQNTLTNDDVVRMVQAGTPQGGVVGAIAEAPAVRFTFLPEYLAILTKAGVSDDIVRAMAAKSYGRPVPGYTATPRSLVAPAVASKPAETAVTAPTPVAPPQSVRAQSKPGEIKLHGYITELTSPTEFQIEDYRINRDATLALELEKDENNPGAPLAFTPAELHIGSEIEIKGEAGDDGVIKASSVRVYLTDHKTVSRTALLSVTPLLQRSAQGWQGELRVDGQTVGVTSSTKVTFLPNGIEKKTIPADKKSAFRGWGAPARGAEVADVDGGDPLQSLESVGPDTWVTYKGARQPDGSILATSVQFKHNQLDGGEARLKKELMPRISALKTSGSELTIRRVGKYRLYPDEQVQEYVRQLGAKLIPEYQRSLAPGSPDRIDFQFFVVDARENNAFSLASGTVVVNSGMLRLLENEAQLAAVLGHEISHVVQEHTFRQQQYHKKALFALRIGAAVAATRGGYALANTATLIEAAVRNGYSRSLEDQADRLGLEYMIGAGYVPREAPRVWKVFTLAEGDERTNLFWSSHNNHTTRRSYLMAELKNNYAGLDYSKLQKGEEPFAVIAGRVKERPQSVKKIRVKY